MPITVTVLDTGGIQPFIFGSNVLRENIGASELVHWATRLWAFEELEKLQIPHNIDLEAAKKDDIKKLYTEGFKVDGGKQEGAEVLYAGGGNTVVLFQSADSEGWAKKFVYQLSRRLLAQAPGLNLYAAHAPYAWAGMTSLPDTVDAALKALGKQKGMGAESMPALGRPVTAACTSTGLPANDRHPDTEGKTGSASRANRQVWTKWKAALDLDTPIEHRLDARTRLRALIPDVGEGKEFEWADDFELLADLPDRDDSYIAVVHADGNGMGQRIKNLTDNWKQKPENPRDYINEMRALSTSVQMTALTALENLLLQLLDHLTDHDGPGPSRHSTKNEYKTINGKRVLVRSQKIFPVRPVVFGGDDVTLVCAGPWGLAVAQSYLAELEKLTMPDGQGGASPPYACAGVAIVKTHYPFSQAYHLSDELIREAKARSKKLAGKKASAIDWHLSTTGLHGDLDTIRAREYTVDAGCLTMRPLMLDGDHTWRNWQNLTGLLTIFGEDGDWQERRNKTMRLREALRGGPAAVGEFWAIFGRDDGGEEAIIRHTHFDSTTRPRNGWVANDPDCLDKHRQPLARCVYFDAIEVADHFFELSEKKEGE